MRRLRGARIPLTIAAVLLVPAVALAEVSVQLDGRGNFKRLWYLTSGKGRPVIWEQVRSKVAPNFVLNPLGDNLGDRAPVIQMSPVTGYPMAVWPKNFGNIRVLAESSWLGTRWSDIALIAPNAALVYEDRDPALAFDEAGTPYVVWSRAEQVARVYFSMKYQGRWTTPMAISDEGVVSRAPSIAVTGKTTVITYQTPSGAATKNFLTSLLVQSATSLMDNPIPPLLDPDSPPGGGGGTPGKQK